MLKTSIIIPTLNAACEIQTLLAAIRRQTIQPDEILIIDSASADDTVRLAKSDPGVRVIPITREAFDHGGTRNVAFGQSTGEIVFFFSQDAVPEDEHYLQTMLDVFADETIAGVYARQQPRADAAAAEKYTRMFNYPMISGQRSKADIDRLGIKAFFFSDVASAYRREAFYKLGGFDEPLPTNEDMLIAWKLLTGGYRIGYCAQTCVVHSHTFPLLKVFKHDFDIGTVMEMFCERFAGVRVGGEGMRYARTVGLRLFADGRLLQLCRFLLYCGLRACGNALGKRWRHLPDRVIMQMTGNPNFWRKKLNGELRAAR